MVKALRRDTALAACVLALGLSLAFIGSALLTQWQDAEQRRQHFTFEHLLGFVASAVGLSVVCWWALSFLLAFLASLLHRVGHRRGADFLSRFSPAFMLRLAVAVMSLNIMGAGVAQADAAAPPEPGWQSASSLAKPPLQVAWTPAPSSHAGSLPPSQEDTMAAVPLPKDPRWYPQPPVIDPGLLSRQSLRSATAVAETAVVVQDGDSLWSIAASRLGPFATDVDVALTWPKWYSANRAVIGSDPTALRPGQVLQPPAPS
ncbi:LysM peptidoglycan-binding domain-containing protein [Paenarthrobacter aurescens]|uniref:LysM domain-containing protein n=1 Tax=Paenarthrobacter aurescens TaxID=43663 RepID=A0A4Y3NH00_PAEAU|nr:LysM domain-containing protein [Paenarthrobacter aurescens]MDO6144112.1 LysM peptidoglycan-binding domain-containing protein [Paenarthrobacter aurescens]MDO6147959.1 LysM peptidoglycan-binding domain-containing protein [Paenarthrobacter aurescens]MDO6159203.1 LysM peptidoglycan-binding domain-containing protein [Paenarthrobacter aurescens]MDO6163187.1 LysM peptidoglycan-binding domain-containing protein [Paenarthrobacter aurescens]GEB18331.1 hypothetical protein AAU01_10860 [Paenarthrobacte